ncbi:MAG: DUF2156 domain-containing protein [Deltaproteobacteria bacterium]
MELKRLSLDDRETLERYLRACRRDLSPYAFPAIYCWKGLFEIDWGIAGDSLCVFFKDATGRFLYLPPLGGAVDRGLLDECFRTMDAVNRNPAVSRIENAAESDLAAYRELGYEPVLKSHDFVYSRKALAALKGDAFKAKRAAVNQFTRNNRFQCRPYAPEHKEACLGLYREWMEARARSNPETVYTGMMADSLNSLSVVLEDLPSLDMRGLVVLIGGRVKAFTLGYRLADDTFCVLFETADLAVKGLPQFVFREFCSSLDEYRFINAMDDSGIEGLRKVKMSYRPQKLLPSYIINRSRS